MTNTKFRYVLADKNKSNILMLSFTLQEIEKNGIDWIYEQFEKAFGGSCDCLNESCNHCECSPVFDQYKIIGRDPYVKLCDREGIEIYANDIYEEGMVKNAIIRPHPHIAAYIMDWSHMSTAQQPWGFLDSEDENGRTYGIVTGNIYENPERSISRITEKNDTTIDSVIEELIDYEYSEYTREELLQELCKVKYRNWPEEDIRERYCELIE